MNWIFVDRQTHEVRFGPRTSAESQLKGPWDVTRQEKRLTFGGWEGFYVVLREGFWSLYFDVDGDELKGVLKEEEAVAIQVEIRRVEVRRGKPEGKGGVTEEEKAGQAVMRAIGGVGDKTEEAAVDTVHGDDNV